MKFKILMLLTMCASTLFGADYVLNKSDDQSKLSENSYENAGNWVLATDTSVKATEGPSSGNTYTVPSGKTLRTSGDEATSPYTFGGDRLTVEGELTVHLANNVNFTVNDLVFKNGVLYMRNAGRANTLYGNVSVPAGYSWELIHWDNNGYTCTWNIGADVSGAGLIRTTGRGGSSTWRNFNFSGDNSGYTGKLDFYGKSTIRIQSATAMFSAPAVATADWMTLNGCTLAFSYDHEVGANGGVVVDNKTDATRIVTAGATVDVAQNKSVVFNGPLSGAGTLTKTGAGKLSFLGGNASFTGEIVVSAGSVELGAGGTYDSYVLRPDVTHVFSQTTPTVAGTLVTAGGLSVIDMTGYDTSKSAPLTIDALSGDGATIRFDCENYESLTAGTAYALLTGPNTVVLTAFANGRFASGDTLGYQLSATDVGGGKATVWMTPQTRLPEWIMSASDTDNANNSFTTKGKWVLKSDPSTAATEPPHGGNVYIVPSETTMRTPDSDNANHTFGGEKLVLRGCLYNKITDNKTLSITNLIVEGGKIEHHLTGRNATITGGTVTVPAGYDLTIVHHESNNGNRNTWSIGSRLLGGGTIRVRGRIATAYRNVNFSGDNSGFTGKFDLFGHSSTYFMTAASMPAAPSVAMSDWMRLSGCGVVFQENATFGANGGLYIANESDANRIVVGEEGGRVEVASGKTVTFNGPLAGDGTLTKKGAGTLVLAGGTTGFTGELVVEAGQVLCSGMSGAVDTLRIVSGETLTFTADKALVVTNLVFAGGALAFDLTDFDTEAPVMLEAQNIDLSVGGVGITCANLGALTVGQPYAIMKGPATVLEAAVRTGVFYPVDPHRYSFQVAEGAGGQATLSVVPADGSKLYSVYANMSSGDFKTGTVWGPSSGDLHAMEAGYRYLDQSKTLRIENATPAAGDCLYLYGASLTFKKTNTQIDFGTSVLRDSVNIGFSAGGRIEPAGDFMLVPSGANGDGVTLYCNGLNYNRPLNLYAKLSGAGRLSLVGHIPPKADGTPTLYSLRGDNRDYVGPIDVSGQTNFYCAISSETSLGGNPFAFRADQVSFNGGGLYATESLTLDDANRGIFTSGAGGLCNCNNEAGTYYNKGATTNTILERTFMGVLSLSTATAETLFRIDCPISGDGGVRVIAPGTVVLGGTNTYSGGTEIVAGRLELKSSTALGEGGLVARSGTSVDVQLDADELPYGVELGGPLVFESGSSLAVTLSEEMGRGKTLPLFLLAPGETADLTKIPLVRRPVRGYDAVKTVRTVTIGEAERQLVEVEFSRTGFTIIVR